MHIARIIPLSLILTFSPLAAFAYNTAPVSEEDPPGVCQTGDAVYAATCFGSYCDRTSLYCQDTNYAVSSRGWSTNFSEEGSNYRRCGANQIMTGISCAGSYCDNVAIECSTIPRSRYNCEEIGPFSEEHGWKYFGGKFANGMRCTGSNCDNHWYYVCNF